MDMKFEVKTHPGVVITDPVIEVVRTIDDPLKHTFTPCVHITFGESCIYHELPAHPYVNGTWSDKNVDDAVTTYFNSIQL